MRSSSIQARTIRTSVLHDIDDLKKTSRLEQAWTIHLTMGLASHDKADPDQKTGYGIPFRVQCKLAQWRTDLDRFSDAEAFALMLSGYRMANHQLEEDPPPFGSLDTCDSTWPFLEFEHVIDDPHHPKYKDLVRELDLGQHAAFRGIRRRLPGYDKRSDV